MSEKFNKIYNQSINNPEKFWTHASNDIISFKKPTMPMSKTVWVPKEFNARTRS